MIFRLASLLARSGERSYGLIIAAMVVVGLFALRAHAQDRIDGVEIETPEVVAGDPPPLLADDPVITPVAQKEGFTRYDALLASLTIFVLAVFVGFEVITKVPPTLHTPLMSGSNAISGITIVGALLATGFGTNAFVAVIGTIALVLATINVVGGFLVTHRMLEMFKKK